MRDNHLQDKNAGNLGDYLKHFWLVRLIETLLKDYPNSSIAYIESHAGAGLYGLTNTNWERRDRYKYQVCDDSEQWETFNKLNPFIKHRLYFGSFVLAGKLLLKNQKPKHKIVLYEKDKAVLERIDYFRTSLLPDLKPECIHKESQPEIIKKEINNLRKKFDIVVCLIDPYSQKECKEWHEAIIWDISNCYVLMFHYARQCGKYKNGQPKVIFYPKENPINPLTKCKCRNPVNDGISWYAMFGNTLSKEQLKKNS